MNTIIKKTVSYLLVILVVVFMTISLLGVWEIIDLDNVIKKLLLSLLVLFAASAVILFIFTVLIRDDNDK